MQNPWSGTTAMSPPTLCACYLSYCLSYRGESTDEEFVMGLLPCDSSGEELTDVRYYVLLLDDSGGLYSNSSTT